MDFIIFVFEFRISRLLLKRTALQRLKRNQFAKLNSTVRTRFSAEIQFFKLNFWAKLNFEIAIISFIIRFSIRFWCLKHSNLCPTGCFLAGKKRRNRGVFSYNSLFMFTNKTNLINRILGKSFIVKANAWHTSLGWRLWVSRTRLMKSLLWPRSETRGPLIRGLLMSCWAHLTY